jgi:hypothetical protein
VDENLADILPKWNAARHLVDCHKDPGDGIGFGVGLSVFTVAASSARARN